MNENFDKIAALLEDTDFATAALSAESAEAVQKMFADKGVELSVTELEAVGNMLSDTAEGELDENDLEQVAGGVGTIVIDPEAIKRLADLIKQNPVLCNPNRVNTTPPILQQFPTTQTIDAESIKNTTRW